MLLQLTRKEDNIISPNVITVSGFKRPFVFDMLLICMCISAGCFPPRCILTLPILDTDGLLGVWVDLAVFLGVVVAAGVVTGVFLPPAVEKGMSKNLFVCLVCIYYAKHTTFVSGYV